MKKMLVLMFVLAVAFSMISSLAFADGSGWICSNCNVERNTEYCPICGNHQPDKMKTTWICPTCGQTLPEEYNFCPDDQTGKSTGNWPVRYFTGVGTSLSPVYNNPDGRRQAYFGPNQHAYAGGGAYKPGHVQNAIALFCEGDYALVDFYDTNVGKCCVYFSTKVLTNMNIEQIVLTPHSARTIAEVQPMEGPGYDYHVVDNTIKNQTTGEWYRKKVVLSQNTRIDVFFETNGWVFAEFSSEIGLARAWIPASKVESC